MIVVKSYWWGFRSSEVLVMKYDAKGRVEGNQH